MVIMDRQVGWVSHCWVGFDTETTGVSPRRDRVVTAAVVMRRGGLKAPRSSQQEWLVNPGIPIPSSASAIHGVSTNQARQHGTEPAQALEEINATLAKEIGRGGVVVVFNAGFDLPLLEADSLRNGVPSLSERLKEPLTQVVDPLVLDRALVKKRYGKRRLSDLAHAYGAQLPEGTHQADVDAHLTLDLLAKMVQTHPKIAKMDLQELYAFQKESHAAWAADFESYLQSVGRKTRIDRRWF